MLLWSQITQADFAVVHFGSDLKLSFAGNRIGSPGFQWCQRLSSIQNLMDVPSLLILLLQGLGNLEEILCPRDPHNDPVHMPSLPVSNEGFARLLKRSNPGSSLIHIIQATSL